jgi:Fe-S oxidoreductase
MYIARALLDKRMDYNESISNLAFTCTGCEACDDICKIIPFSPPYAFPSDVIRLLRYELVRRNIIPDGKIREIYEALQGNKFIEKMFIEKKIFGKMGTDDADIVLFAECIHSKEQKIIFDSAFSLLKKIGIPIRILSDGGCCGSTLYEYGFWDAMNGVVDDKLQVMKKLNAKEFLFINPHCQEFVQKMYPQINPQYAGVPASHFIEFLLDAFKENKLRGKTNKPIKVTYHDPCHLGRGLGIYDPPRVLLSSLDGVQLIEMEGNRRNSLCCGAKAINSYFPNFSEFIALKKIEQFNATKADLLITACPYCKEAFRNMMGNDRQSLVKDLIEFVDERTE